jgi:lysozyme
MDRYFDHNWSGMKSAGLIRGAYQFFEPRMSATEQANIVVRAVGRLGPGDLPVTLDVETATPTFSEIRTWMDIVQQGTGKKPMIYTAPGLWNSWLSSNFGAPLWVATIGSHPIMPHGWGDWNIWQYSWSARVSGIGGNTDVDVVNGGENALKRLAGA